MLSLRASRLCLRALRLKALNAEDTKKNTCTPKDLGPWPVPHRMPLTFRPGHIAIEFKAILMTKATDFEFSNRWWIFGAIFGAGFFFFLVDHVPVGARIADYLIARMQWSEALALHVVFGVSALIMILAALVRAWGSAYLGRDVVHDHAVHSEALKADGPYRHVRNPLYFGNVLMSWAFALCASVIGALLIVIGILVFCYRLIGREEAALEAEQGDRYRAFKNAVPRLWPSLRPRIPPGGAKPDWISGLAAEAFFISFALGIIGFAISLNVVWFYAGFVASPLLSWLAGLAVRKRGHLTVPSAEK
jgi:protein-S-isoprenylcysteine O-methyltransferase Ste14